MEIRCALLVLGARGLNMDLLVFVFRQDIDRKDVLERLIEEPVPCRYPDMRKKTHTHIRFHASTHK